jgi:membrane protease YdiL (CAAX protease family)
VWGIWHFPLILIGHNSPAHPVAGVGMMIVYCILMTPMMIYIVKKSKSVITASIFHGVNNAIGGITLLYLVGGNDLTNNITGLAGSIALLIMNIAFFIFDKYVTKENIFTSAIGD